MQVPWAAAGAQQGVGNLPGLLTALPRASLTNQPLLPSPGAEARMRRKIGVAFLLSPISVLKSKTLLDPLNTKPFWLKKTDQQDWSYTKEGMAAAPPAASCWHLGLGEKQPLTDSPGPASATGMPWTVKHFLVSLTPGASRANQAVVLFCQVIKLPAARPEAPRRVSFCNKLRSVVLRSEDILHCISFFWFCHKQRENLL